MTREEELLLQAAVGPAERTRAAWAAWRAEYGDLDSVSRGGLKLAPQLHTALQAADLDDPDLARLKGVQRHAWSRNQILGAQLASALGTLAGAGIDTLVLKGTALAALHYRHPGQRPMDDADVLVRPADRDRALAVLAAAGWTPDDDRLAQHLVTSHAVGLHRAGGGRIDLHWRAQHEPADDGPLWDAAVDLTVHGAPAKAPCPADLLLMVCVHARRYHPEPLVRWAADAHAIIAGGVDWDRFTARARAANLTLPASDALRALNELLAIPTPRLKPSAPLRSRLAYRRGLRPYSTLNRLPALYDDWHRARATGDPDQQPPPLVDYLAAGCGQTSRADFAKWVVTWPRRASIPSAKWRSASTSRA